MEMIDDLEFDIEENIDGEVERELTEEEMLDILAGSPAVVSQEIKISRLKGVKFTVQSISQKTISTLRKKCTKSKLVKGTVTEDFNDELFNALLLQYGIVKPKITREILDKAKCSNAYNFLQKTLLPGEINLLIQGISECSGFNLELTNEQIKNV